MSHVALHNTLNALPANEWENFDVSDLVIQADRDDWALLKLVACIAVATVVIALAVSLA
jgi:hypothetical protein